MSFRVVARILIVAALLVVAAGCTRADTSVTVRADGTAEVTVTVTAHPTVAAAAAASSDGGPVTFADQIGITIPDDADIEPYDDGTWDGWAATFDVDSPDALLATFSDVSGDITVDDDGVWTFDAVVGENLLDEIAGSGDSWGQVSATVAVTFDEIVDAGTGAVDGDTVSWDLADPGFDGTIAAVGAGSGDVAGDDDSSTRHSVRGAVSVLIAAGVIAGLVGTARRRR